MKIMSLVLASLLLVPLAALHAAAATAPEAKPNILIILADDLGYADVGFQGSKDIPTPHLDRLARAGLHCTSGYVSHPFCSPSRAGLLTGRYQQRFGHEYNPEYDPNNHQEGLPTSEKLLPEFLVPAGYATGCIGKWHLGAAPEFRPENRGFQEFFGFYSGGHHYLNQHAAKKGEINAPLVRNGKPVEVEEHLTLALGHEAAAFVERHKTQPWLLYLAFNAPHKPHEPTPERLAQFASIANEQRRAYAAQVSLLDDAIGETLAALHESGQEQRTLVFFLSDNGGPDWLGPRNAPLRGGKYSVLEGGVHVPFVVSWPGKLPEGRDYTLPVSALDIFPTALTLAGVPLPTHHPSDGVDLMPFLSGANPKPPHETLFWRTGGSAIQKVPSVDKATVAQIAVRHGDLKLVHIGEKPGDSHAGALFELTTDIGESKNLVDTRAKDVEFLNKLLDDWNKLLVPPAFSAGHSTRAPGRKGGEIVEPEF